MDKRLRYLPDGFDVPTTPLEALKAGRAVLEEEGRWCQGDEFDANSERKNAKDPFCGNWQACAVGAVGLVTLGVEPRVYYYNPKFITEPSPRDGGEVTACDYWSLNRVALDDGALGIYNEACRYLDMATAAEADYYDSVVEYNDSEEGTREDILRVFDYAIEKLENNEW